MPRIPSEPEPIDTGKQAGRLGVTPYLAVADARRALDWYADVLGARPLGEPILMPDDRIGHAELELGGAVLMLADEHPEMGVTAPVPGQGAAVTLHLDVPDVDDVTARAVGAGARLDRAPADHPYGRNAVVVDPFGHRWMLSGPPAAQPAGTRDGSRQGEVSYASLWLPDVEVGAAFYQKVLGWSYAPGSEPQGRLVEGVHPPLGLWGGQERRTAFLCFAVDDVAAALERVRVAGGQADEPRREHGGLLADCVDDQGMVFALSEVQSPAPRLRPQSAPEHGELAYLTLGVPDTERARAFFSAVLGWRFAPGRTVGGWNIEGSHPKVGMHGGVDRPVVVPMYAVDDIADAVARVRTAGGTATDPEVMPYGITSNCTDDQRVSFYLGQLG